MVEKGWEMVGGKEGAVAGRGREKGEGLYRVYLANIQTRTQYLPEVCQ